MATTDAEIEAAVQAYKNGPRDKWGERMIRPAMCEALEAAASVRAEVGAAGMEILRVVAAIPLWRDKFPDSSCDVIAALGADVFGLTPAIVRQARALVAAPTTAGPSRTEGAPMLAVEGAAWIDGRNVGIEEAARICETWPIPPAYGIAREIRTLKTTPSPQPPTKANSSQGWLHPDNRAALCSAWGLQPPASPSAGEGVPDVAGLIDKLRNRAALHDPAALLALWAADALTAQAAEIKRLNEVYDVARKGISAAARVMANLDNDKVVLAAKEAEIERAADIEVLAEEVAEALDCAPEKGAILEAIAALKVRSALTGKPE